MTENTFLTHLRTNSRVTPLGIDSGQPSFSWVMESDQPGKRQTAYRLMVSEKETMENPVWDTGTVMSGDSRCIRYAGRPLSPSTRYFWQAAVTDENYHVCMSDITWFETGLMGTDSSVWSGAEWIGAPTRTTSTAALSSYEMTLQFLAPKGNKAGIVLSARNKDNFVLFEIDMDRRLLFVKEYNDNAWDGSCRDGNVPTAVTLGNPGGYRISEKAVPDSRLHQWNHLDIRIAPPEKSSPNAYDPFKKPGCREVTVLINRIPVISGETDLLSPSGPFVPKRFLLLSVGFCQPESTAFYDDVAIFNPITKDVYASDSFSDASGCLSVLGSIKNGILEVTNRFEITCPVPAVNLLKGFLLDKDIVSARFYAAARGVYELRINGYPADSSFFHPGFTDYRLRIAYQTYDVSALLHTGLNRILVTVGKGYYNGYCGYSGPLNYGEQNSFLGKLVLTFEDGSRLVLPTGPDWLFSSRGPVNDSDFLDGENYDARLEFTGWETASYADSCWKPCGIFPWPSDPEPTNGSFSEHHPFLLSAETGSPVQIERILSPVLKEEPLPGHFIYDFGQNMVGTIRLTLRGPRGLSLKIRYGEMIYPDGELYIRNLRSAACTDTYTFRGDPDREVFLPSFTFHGFRYAEITGNGTFLENSDCILSIEGLVLCNTPDTVGEFTCSDPLINRLQSNIQWSQRGNSLLVFTDCPQRNERMGWTGDAQVFAPTAAFNMDIRSFTDKWLSDVRDAQLMYNRQGAVPDTAPLGGDNRPDGCAGWGDAAVIVPWEMYLAYGDPRILEENYDCMAKWIGYQSREDRQNRGLRTVEGKALPNQSDFSSKPFLQVQQRRGDHLSFDPSTPFILSATAYAAYVSLLMAKIAAILHKEEDAACYQKRYEDIRQAFQEAWVTPDGGIAYWGEMSCSREGESGTAINRTRYSEESGNPCRPSQTAYALAIDFGLMPQKTMDRTAQYFSRTVTDRACHLSCGFLGIAHLLPALSKIGRDDLAFALLEQKTSHGWLYSVINGATTIWERWNSYIAETGTFGDVSMNSFNHYAYGAVGQWLYRSVLGIQSSDEAGLSGYRRILLTPHWGGTLTFASGWHYSPEGRIFSGWKKDGGRILYTCTIPANASALLTLPKGFRCLKVLKGSPVFREAQNQSSAFELAPGKYEFVIV